MGIHTKTIAKLEDTRLCEAVIQSLKHGYNKKYIQKTYSITRRELERIIERYMK